MKDVLLNCCMKYDTHGVARLPCSYPFHFMNACLIRFLRLLFGGLGDDFTEVRNRPHCASTSSSQSFSFR